MLDGYRQHSNEEIFLFELMDFTHLIGPNEKKSGFSDYRLETPKGIGFIITAVKHTTPEGGEIWTIDSWYTYNA